jgi:hypothetical protein
MTRAFYHHSDCLNADNDPSDAAGKIYKNYSEKAVEADKVTA